LFYVCSLSVKTRGRPKKYKTEEEKLQMYKEVHKNSCKKYWKGIFEKSKLNDCEKIIVISEQQLMMMIDKIVEEKLKNLRDVS